MKKARSLPQRMCVACRQMKDKKALIRIVRSPQGEIMLDKSGKLPGRGAYLCAAPACFAKARKAHSLEKALKQSLSAEVWQALEEQLTQEMPVAPQTPIEE